MHELSFTLLSHKLPFWRLEVPFMHGNVAKRACDQCSIFIDFNNFDLTTGFYWSYTLLL